jgi:16S rRNA (guanine966-N2)-methyltransferase
LRIIAGSARGIRLLPPRSADIRPTSDRVRESLFNLLGQWLDGQNVLDLFAGTGALGLEALSRGAATAVFVDSKKEAIELCRANAQKLGFADKIQILPRSVPRALEELSLAQKSFHLIFADPPYAARLSTEIAERVEALSLLDPEGTLCLEHDRREAVPERAARLARVDLRKFGDTCISLYRLA